MKKIILAVFVLPLICASATAQSYIDNALLFSRTAPAGSARIQAMGGAQVALGGDFSLSASNPAGLGMYNRSEFTFGLGFNSSNAKSSFMGNSESSNSSNINIPGLSLILHTPSNRESGFLGGSFAISLTRTNDLNLDYRYSGLNSAATMGNGRQSSIIDYFIDYSNGSSPSDVIDPDDFLWDSSEPGAFYNTLAGLAYRAYLTEDRQDASGIFYDSQLDFDEVTQQEVLDRRGAQYQWSIAYGANFSDKFFLGGTVGIATIRWVQNQTFQENDFRRGGQQFDPLNEFSMDESFDIRGSGVNLSVGAIYRPVDFLQVGASFTTPTYYSLTDTYDASLVANWNNFDYYPDDPNDDLLGEIREDFSDAVLYEYSLSTPLRLRTGAAVFLGKNGIISGEVEFIDYSRSKYRSDIAGEFDGDNDAIRTEFQSTMNFAIGGEYRLNAIRLRAGYNLQGDPLRDNAGVDRSIGTYSAGIGYRASKFFIDFTGAYSSFDTRRTPYFVEGLPDPVADISVNVLRFLATVGINF